MEGYIYIIHVREFLNTNIYKVGRTIDIFKRFKQYPKGSALLFCCKVINCVKTERAILNQIKGQICREYGLEYCNMQFQDLYDIVIQEITHSNPKKEITLFIKHLQKEKCKNNNNVFYNDQIIYYFQKWCQTRNVEADIPSLINNLLDYTKENKNITFDECFYYEKIWNIY